MSFKPGDIVKVQDEFSNWWPLNLNITSGMLKAPADMSFALVLSTVFEYNSERPYNVRLLTRDCQIVTMRYDMLEKL